LDERRSARGFLGALERTKSLPACGKFCCGADGDSSGGSGDDAHVGPPGFSGAVCVPEGRALETAVDPLHLSGSGANGLIDAMAGGVLRESDERLDSEGFSSEGSDCECFDSERLDCECLGCGCFGFGSDCECFGCL
jgi:hypothetical protein